jgi:hypothetical protein
MIHPEEYLCPLCGLILPSLAAFHQHYAKIHQSPIDNKTQA